MSIIDTTSSKVTYEVWVRDIETGEAIGTSGGGPLGDGRGMTLDMAGEVVEHVNKTDDTGKYEYVIVTSTERTHLVETALAIAPKVTYEVWDRDIETKQMRGVAGGTYGLVRRGPAEMIAEQYNDEERENAREERRKVRSEYVIVAATTTYSVED